MTERTDIVNNLTLEAFRSERIGRILLHSSRIFEDIVLQHLGEHGFKDIRSVHLNFLGALNAEGSRTTEISKLINSPKQGVGQLAKELEKLGYVSSVPDPKDGRARIIKFTGKGKKLAKQIPAVLEETEIDFSNIVGKKQLAQVKSTLTKLITAKIT